MYVCMYVCLFVYVHAYVIENRPNSEDAPRGSAVFFNIFEMLRTGARFNSEFSGRSARLRDFLQNFQDAPHGNAILNERPMNI